MSKSLTNKAIQQAADDLGVEVAAIRAVDDVESRGSGFVDDDHVKILFERHVFHRLTDGKYDDSHPNLSNVKAGGYGPEGLHQNYRFSKAFEIDPDAAMQSASWGRYQIMGFNHAAAGFKTVGEFVDAMKTGEDGHLKAFVNFIKDKRLVPELRMHDWAGFARQYNGKAFKKNRYDEKLADAYERFSKQRFDADEVPTESASPPATEKPVATEATVVVQAEVAKETNPKEKAEVSGPKSWIAAVTTFMASAGAGVFSWAKGASTEIVVAFFASAALVGVVYVVARYWYRNKENQRLADVQLAREKMAQEITLMKMKSAMQQESNTVEVAH